MSGAVGSRRHPPAPARARPRQPPNRRRSPRPDSAPPSRCDEMVELAARRGPPPLSGSPYSDFLDWASNGALLPFGVETALAIHVWGGWQPTIPTGARPRPAPAAVKSPPKSPPGFGGFG